MKIAITHTRYSLVGGVEKYIYSLVERLLDTGHEVHYFCHFWEKDADPRIRFHKIINPFKTIRVLKVWSFDRWSQWKVNNDEFDIVHGFTKTAQQDIYTDGSGCLHDYQEYSIKEGEGSALAQKLKRLSPHQRLVERIEEERFTRGNFRRILTMSIFAQKQICRRYGLAPEEVEVIYNGIDLRNFNASVTEQHRAPMRKRLNYTDNDIVALLVGNDYRRKGVITLMEALKKIEDQGGVPDGRKLHVAVVGKERHGREKELYMQAQEMGLTGRVRFYGPQRDIAEWHGMSDIHILPSRFDIFGNVVLEAMAMGVPTIVSAMAGAAEVVKEAETGYVLQDPKDSDELASLILKTIGATPDRLIALGENARLEAEKYSWDRHFTRMLEIYAEVKAAKARDQAAP
jgi:UDP-glucose:(heptosyl)LPS alpha-1,3-glucosyltransferase